MNEIRRVDPEPPSKVPPLAGQPQLAKSSFVVMLVSALAGLAAFGLSIYFFLGFAENDVQFGALSSAFLLCFGVGALAYGPMFWITNIARRVRLKGPSKRDVLLVLALMIPWLILSMSLIATRFPLIIIGVVLTVLCMFILTWAWAVFRAA